MNASGRLPRNGKKHIKTYVNATRFIALSAILTVMGLASYEAAANSGAIPTAAPYYRNNQVARTSPGDYQAAVIKEGQIMYSNPGHPGDKVYLSGNWFFFYLKENRKATNAFVVPSAPALASFTSFSPKEGEIMNFPLSGRSAIYKNGQWINLP